MRKFLFNGAIIGSVFGAVAAVRNTRQGPRDWRLLLTWVAWAATTAIAVGNVIYEQREQEYKQAQKRLESRSK